MSSEPLDHSPSLVPSAVIAALSLVLLVSPRESFAQVRGFATRPVGVAEFDLRVGAAYSDNLRRTAVNPESGSYDFLGLRANYNRNGTRLDINLLGDVEIRSYSDSTLSSEPVGSFNADMTLDLVPERFSWALNDYYGQGAADPFVPVGPDNRQEYNIASTGPNFVLPLGQRAFFTANLRRSESQFENTGYIDNSRDSIDISITRRLSSTATFGLGASDQKVEFDVDSLTNDRESLFVSYARQLATGQASVRVGESVLKSQNFETSTPLIDVSWVRRIGARSRLGLSYSRDYSDVSDAYTRANLQSSLGPILGEILLVQNLYEFKQAAVNYGIDYARTRFTFGVSIGESRYDGSTALDNDEKNFSLGISRDIGTRGTLDIVLMAFHRDYFRVARKDLDTSAQVSFVQDFGSRFFFSVALLRYARDSRDQSSTNYEENSVRLMLGIDLNP